VGEFSLGRVRGRLTNISCTKKTINKQRKNRIPLIFPVTDKTIIGPETNRIGFWFGLMYS
jgi:hypothetical protein